MKAKIEELKKKTDENNLNDLLIDIIKCDDLAKYKKKMAGMALPFNTRDKNYRIPVEETSRRYKFESVKTPDEIKQEMNTIRNKREQEKNRKKKEEQRKYERNREILKKLHIQQLKQKHGTIEAAESKPVERPQVKNTISKEANKQKIEDNKKITWEILKDLTYKDVKKASMEEDDFKPSDLFNDSDGEDVDIINKIKNHERSKEKPMKSQTKKNEASSVAHLKNSINFYNIIEIGYKGNKYGLKQNVTNNNEKYI